MATRSNAQQNVLLDLNAPSFQRNLLGLDKTLRNEALNTLQKIIQMNWQQVYRDQGLKWKKSTPLIHHKALMQSTPYASRSHAAQSRIETATSCASSPFRQTMMRRMARSDLASGIADESAFPAFEILGKRAAG